MDQGIEHSAGASFAKNPLYFDPENIVKLAIEGGCNAVASTLGGAGHGGAQATRTGSRSCMKFNHNEFLTYPNKFDQIMFAPAKQALDMGAVAVGATDLLRLRRVGAADRRRSAWRSSSAHELGLATVLWCYLRNPAFKTTEKDFHVSADLTGQANHLGRHDRGRHHQAEAAREQRRLHRALHEGEPVRQDRQVACTTKLATDNPIDWTRYQVANCYMGRAGLINSGGASG